MFRKCLSDKVAGKETESCRYLVGYEILGPPIPPMKVKDKGSNPRKL